jgi:hypothetical protein
VAGSTIRGFGKKTEILIFLNFLNYLQESSKIQEKVGSFKITKLKMSNFIFKTNLRIPFFKRIYSSADLSF